MDSFNKLADLFRRFPGIGPRQAKRFVYFLLARDKSYLETLTRHIAALKREIGQCESCFRYFPKERSRTFCALCADKTRDDTLLMVVAKDVDVDAIEKSGTYGGRYFVLGGTIPLVKAKATGPVRVKELASLIGNRVNPRTSASSNQRESAALKEIILALSLNTEGEYTADELRKSIAPLLTGTLTKITTLGRGLSTGSELEYADKETLKSALKNRSV